MPPVPSITGAQAVRALEKAGFSVARIRGSHQILRHDDGRTVSVPVHHGRDLPKGTLRNILSLVGISADDLADLL
ncbi:type II toxin-antitoxin system HicA family toxin [Nonomuraea sp. NPDC050022]|uniref:type II toxin-antitoxin system HicA family toxin n=1 Tax=unclassified Nonomuraea TaxID=2593643 RepID=UPI0033F02054